VATSTLRAVLLAALVVLGVIGLTKLFPQNESLGITGATPGTQSTGSPSPGSSVSPSASPTRKAKVKGVVVLVLNGTSRKGLAAEVSRTLESAGYKPKVPRNAPRTIKKTIVYYRSDSLPEAQLIVRKYFPDAILKPAPSSVPQDVRVQIVLGADFVASSPSP